MHISTKGTYSLEALLYLALQPEGVYTSTREIAQYTGISDAYLEQLFIPLRKDALITGIRGPLGGYFLGKAVEKITVGEILRSVEGDLKIADCIDAMICPVGADCSGRKTWQELYQGITGFIDSITLADLVENYHKKDEPEYTI